MKILIIGSKGFIGSSCLRYFVNSGHEVYGCDVVTDYNDPYYFKVDASNANFEDVFASTNFDCCINCSGAASVPDSLIHPLRDYSLNTHNTFLLLEAIRKFNTDCRFISLSSAAVYGNPKSLPIRESDPVDPISPYGSHKYYGEMICEEFNRHYAIRTCSLRIFSAYGEGLKKQLFWDVAMKAKAGGSIQLFGTGQERRDFIYIDDLILAIHKVLECAAFNGERINIGSGTSSCIENAVESLLTHLHWKGKVLFSKQERLGDPSEWVACTSLLNSFDFQPSYSLDEGLKRYALWLREEKLV